MKFPCIGGGGLLLHSIQGQLWEGRLCAIMGPSGAGKSTLLNLLALQPPANTVAQGYLEVLGEPLTDASFRAHCAYVPQVLALAAAEASGPRRFTVTRAVFCLH